MDGFKINIHSLIKPDDSSLKNIAQRNFFRVSPTPSASTQKPIENEHPNNHPQQQQQQLQQQQQFRQSSQYFFQNNQQSYQLQPQKSLQSVGNFTMNKLISINEIGEILLNPVSEWNDQVVFNTKDHSNLNMHLLGSQSFNPNANFSLIQSKLFKGESFRINMNPSEQSKFFEYNCQNNNSNDNNHSDARKTSNTQEILKCSTDDNNAVGMQQSIELDNEQTQSYLKSMVPYQNSTNSSLKVSYPQSVQQGKSQASDQANQGDSNQQESLYYQSKQQDQRINENNNNTNVQFRDTWRAENNLKPQDIITPVNTQQQKIINPNDQSNCPKEEQDSQQFQQQVFQEQLGQNNTREIPAVRIDQNTQQQGEQIQQQVVQQQYQYQQPYQNNNNFQQLTFANSPLYFLNNNLSDCQSKVCEVIPSGLAKLPNSNNTTTTTNPNPTYIQQQQQQQPQYSISGIAPLNNNFFNTSSFPQKQNLNQQNIYENNSILNNNNNDNNITNYRAPVIAPQETNVGLYFQENPIQNSMNIPSNNNNNNNNNNQIYYPYQYQYQYYTPAFPANTALITAASNPYMQISSSNGTTDQQQQQQQFQQQKYSLNLSKILDVSSNSSNNNNNNNNSNNTIQQKSSFFLENSNKICLIDSQLKAQCDEVRSEIFDDNDQQGNNPENSLPCDMEEYHPESQQELQNTTIFQVNTPMESYQLPSASDESKSHKREVKLISKTKKISRQKKDLENKYRQSQHKNVFKNFGGTMVRFTLYNPHFQDRLATEFFTNDADKRDFEEWLQQDARLTNKSEFLKAWITFKEDQPEVKRYKDVLKELSRDFFENFALIYLMNTSKISNFEVHLRSVYTYLAALNNPETLDRFKPTPLQPLE